MELLLARGLTDRLTVGVLLPFRWVSNDVTAALNTADASVGKNPGLNTLAPLAMVRLAAVLVFVDFYVRRREPKYLVLIAGWGLLAAGPLFGIKSFSVLDPGLGQKAFMICASLGTILILAGALLYFMTIGLRVIVALSLLIPLLVVTALTLLPEAVGNQFSSFVQALGLFIVAGVVVFKRAAILRVGRNSYYWLLAIVLFGGGHAIASIVWFHPGGHQALGFLGTAGTAILGIVFFLHLEYNIAARGVEERERRYRFIFDAAAVSLWEEDATALLEEFGRLRKSGVSDLRQYLRERPEYLMKAVGLIKVRDVNEESVLLHDAPGKDELIRSLHETFLPETLPVFADQMVALFEGRRRHVAEATVRTLTEARREVILSTVFPAWGTEPGITLVSMTDITERKRAEDALRIANEELLAVNRVILACVGSLDLEAILDRVLDEALRITGLEGGAICLVTPEETLRIAAHRAVPAATGADPATHAVKIGDCLCGECARDRKPLILADRQAVLRFSTREATRGEDIRFHAAFPIVAGKRCVGVLCVFTRTDLKPEERSLKLLETVSAQIALAIDNAHLYAESLHQKGVLEENVRERTADLEAAKTALMSIVDDLNQKTREIENANNKLKELDRLKSMFIASMSHELRTPLNSIIGFSGVLLQGMSGELNGEQKEQLGRVFHAGKHLLSLITDVIDIAKIESGRIQPEAGEFTLQDLVREACESLKVQLKEKGLELRLDLPELPVRMNTDRRRLLQCLLNYVGNAVKFTVNGSIVVSARDEGEQVAVSVTDTGIGIKESNIGLLFASFVRLDSPLKTTTPGTGLGLYLTKKLVTEVLGGEVAAASTEGAGSTFSLTIPRVLPAQEQVG